MPQEDPYKKYYKQSEPEKRYRGYIWHTAIGLQAVDGLQTSSYLHELAQKNIDGAISIDEAQSLLASYYEAKPQLDKDERIEEADVVASRIADELSEKAFSFTPREYLSIHKKLFEGIYRSAGKVRDFNIYKKEWVLDGETVTYGSASELLATLEYDMAVEKDFSYKNLSIDDSIKHLAKFVSRLWQIHIFDEGNTRTTAVFFIKYLRTLGFDVTNTIFAENAWYFRNALVRANYNDIKNGIYETTAFVELFLRNLLLGEQNELYNRSMHISFENESAQKANVEIQKANIGAQKANIEKILEAKLEKASKPTIVHIVKLFNNLDGSVFGRSDVETITGLKPTRASALLKQMVEGNVIEPVIGAGKGKYRFIEKAEESVK